MDIMRSIWEEEGDGGRIHVCAIPAERAMYVGKYRDGQTVGRLDARQRNAKMGYSTRQSEATRHSAPLAPTGLNRKEYEEGWSVGYSAGYDSYSK